MNYLKLAQIFNRSRWQTMSVWRKGTDEYWITDTYVMIRLDHSTFSKFKSKYCSFKNNPYIPDLEIDQKIRIQERRLLDRGVDMQKIINEEAGAKTVDFIKMLFVEPYNENYNAVYVGDDFAGAIDYDYFQLFGWDNTFKAHRSLSPVFVYNDKGELYGVMMPIRYFGELEKEIEKFKAVLKGGE